MDCLYDNLDNYEDHVIIDDLKNENKELKTEIEKYSVALNQLQKDFDKLSSEYKNLEKNYSSLLKTAKAEIERKTQMITNLNIEKDMIVIKTLQTRGKGFLNSIRNVNMSSKINSLKNTTEDRKARSKSPPKKEVQKEQVETNVKVCKDVKEFVKSCDAKENISDDKHSNQSERIMNRRKSMPSARKFEEDRRAPMVSSEDEIVNPLRNPRLNNIEHSDKKSNRTSETSSMDDKYSSHSLTSKDHSSRCKNRRSRHDDNYRNTDKYESRHHRRPESPERWKHNKLTDSKYGKQRSPLSDRHRRYKSRDRRSNYEIDHPRYNDRSEKHAIKHKMLPHFEEPSHKKIRIDSYGEYLREDRGRTQREHVNPSIALTSPDDSYRTCQSPDHFAAESSDQKFITEIRLTAATPLEDPRISSNKYLLKTENDKAVLKTTSSQNIDIIMVNKAVWGVPKIIVPDALLEKPPSPRMTDEFEGDYNIDIYNFECDVSLESGEIGLNENQALFKTKSESINLNDKNKTKNCTDIYEKEQAKDKHLDHKLQNKLTIPISIKQQPFEVKSHVLEEKVLINENPSKQTKELETTTFPKINTGNVQIGNEECLPVVNDAKPNSGQSITIDNSQKNQICSIGTVERDLLLSDDASDNMDLPNLKTTDDYVSNKSKEKALREHKTKGSSNLDALCEESKNKSDQLSQKQVDKTTKPKRECSSTSKSKKSKKKQETKSKEQNKELVTNRSKSKKENEIKVDEIKTKFSDLFGESTSLIMPEDLGIDTPTVMVEKQNQFDSVYDDTQSAVDLQVEQKDKVEETLEKNENVKPDCDSAKIVIKSDSTVDNALIDIKKLIKDNLGNEQFSHIDAQNNDKVNLYENLNPEVSMDGSNVVIISTGVQPICTDNRLINGGHVTNMHEKLPPINHSLPVLKALATSTPLKITTETMQCVDEQTAKIVAILEPSNNMDTSTKSNTIEQANEPDVPDVRIFVKRRRKVKK